MFLSSTLQHGQGRAALQVLIRSISVNLSYEPHYIKHGNMIHWEYTQAETLKLFKFASWTKLETHKIKRTTNARNATISMQDLLLLILYVA
jgi:hypothetical protein